MGVHENKESERRASRAVVDESLKKLLDLQRGQPRGSAQLPVSQPLADSGMRGCSTF